MSPSLSSNAYISYIFEPQDIYAQADQKHGSVVYLSGVQNGTSNNFLIHKPQNNVMCIALPGRVLGVNGREIELDFSGVRKKARSDFVAVKKGDYVLVFGGNVIEVIDKERAEETLKILRGD